MGIRFACIECGYMLNVKEHLAGKRGICPKCQAKFRIPNESGRPAAPLPPASAATEVGGAPSVANATVSSANAALAGVAQPDAGQPSAANASGPGMGMPSSSMPYASAPQVAVVAPSAPMAMPVSPLVDVIEQYGHLQWYTVPPGTTSQFGPASASVFRQWVGEGRISPDSMIWCEAWPQWRRAGDVLPQLQPVNLPPHAPALAGVPAANVWNPAAAPAWQAAPLAQAAMAQPMPQAIAAQHFGAQPVMAQAVAATPTQAGKPFGESTNVAATRAAVENAEHKRHGQRTLIILLALVVAGLVPLVIFVLKRS